MGVVFGSDEPMSFNAEVHDLHARSRGDGTCIVDYFIWLYPGHRSVASCCHALGWDEGADFLTACRECVLGECGNQPRLRRMSDELLRVLGGRVRTASVFRGEDA